MLDKCDNNINNYMYKNHNINATTDVNGVIQSVNDAFCNISGYTRDEIIGNTFKLIRHPETPAYFYKDLWDTLNCGQVWSGIFRNKNKYNETYILNSFITHLTDNENKIVGYTVSSYEIKDYLNEIITHKDPTKHTISGLYNREVMFYNMENEQADFIKIAIINIDGFKNINDYYGYLIADDIIRNVAKKISSLIPSDIELFHLSIDEFALVKKGTKHNIYNCDTCEKISLELNSKPIQTTNNVDMDISVSIGVSCGTDVWQVLKETDLSVNHSKEFNIPIVKFFETNSLCGMLDTRIKVIKDLRAALVSNNIIPWTQDIRDNKIGEIVKSEALMRMVDPTGSVISPLNFLDISKKTKLYEKISYMMINKTLDYFSNNSKVFNINISWDDLKVRSTINLIIDYLEKYDTLGPRMTIEILESEHISNWDIFDIFLDKVREFGVKLALDDFGSGYSNFIYLEKIKADYIKIDGTLIQSMMKNENTLFIVESIVAIAKKIGVKTIAEFVSDEEIQKKVESLGIDYSQGYYIGKPKPIN